MLIPLPPVDQELAALGRRLRGLREARGVSGQELAAQMGVRPEALGLAERGRGRLTSGELYKATLALRAPMRLLFEDADLSAVRPF